MRRTAAYAVRTFRLPMMPAVIRASRIAPSSATAAASGNVNAADFPALGAADRCPELGAAEAEFWLPVSRASWTSDPEASCGRRRIQPGCSWSAALFSVPPSFCA